MSAGGINGNASIPRLACSLNLGVKGSNEGWLGENDIGEDIGDVVLAACECGIKSSSPMFA